MNTYSVFLYLFLLSSYLGVSKLLSPGDYGMAYITQSKNLQELSVNEEFSAVLIDMHTTGFIIKTYYQKYRLFIGIHEVEEVIIRTSRDFYKKSKAHIGLSLFRKNKQEFSTTPMPPGIELVGNTDYGQWTINSRNELEWIFYQAYKNLPLYLGWGEFRPNQKFYEIAKSKDNEKLAFFGVEDEFGPNGKLTREFFPSYFKNEKMKKTKIRDFIFEYIKNNF